MINPFKAAVDKEIADSDREIADTMNAAMFKDGQKNDRRQRHHNGAGTTDEAKSLKTGDAEAGGAATEGGEAGPDDPRVPAQYTIAVIIRCQCEKHVAMGNAEAIEIALSGGGIIARCDCGTKLEARPAPGSTRLVMETPRSNRHQRRAQAAIEKRSKGGIIVP